MADILIRGMEMPKEGEKILIAADGSVWVNAWPTRGYMRKENVYAVPIPEGHGRLIDADAFCRFVANNSRIDGIIAAGIISYVNSAPTIIPAEGGTDNGD